MVLSAADKRPLLCDILQIAPGTQLLINTAVDVPARGKKYISHSAAFTFASKSPFYRAPFARFFLPGNGRAQRVLIHFS